MTSWRRSARNQAKRPNYSDADDHQQAYELQGHHDVVVNPGMGMMLGMTNMGMGNMVVGDMGMGNMGWQMGHHSAEGFLNAGHQYVHNSAYSYPYAHQQQYQPVDTSQNVATDEPVPSTSRSLRMRPNVTASNTTSGRSRKSGSSTASGSAANMSQPPAREIDSDCDDMDENNDGTGKSKYHHKLETALTIDQMVQNVLYYLLLQQHKKLPAKRSDILKYAMNSQHKQFSEAMKKLENVLQDVFGMKLVQLSSKGKDQLPDGAPATTAGNAVPEPAPKGSAAPSAKKIKGKGVNTAPPTYFLISKFPSSVFKCSMQVMGRGDPEADSKGTTLYLTLATIFMLNRPIEEELIWKIIHDMNFAKIICKTKDELRKFLKSEYVLPGYLNMETNDQSTHPNARKHTSVDPTQNDAEGNLRPMDSDVVKAKYSWGPRAEKEYSKYSMLKFVAARFPGRKMYEFTVQYNMVQTEEKEMMDKELFAERGRDTVEHSASADADNGSALRIKQKPGGKGESYSIDGENTETETEGVE